MVAFGLTFPFKYCPSCLRLLDSPLVELLSYRVNVSDLGKQVGCGAGNAVFPLIATYPDVFVHACDFSQRAVNLVKV